MSRLDKNPPTPGMNKIPQFLLIGLVAVMLVFAFLSL
jgi:hypothetical protein